MSRWRSHRLARCSKNRREWPGICPCRYHKTAILNVFIRFFDLSCRFVRPSFVPVRESALAKRKRHAVCKRRIAGKSGAGTSSVRLSRHRANACGRAPARPACCLKRFFSGRRIRDRRKASDWFRYGLLLIFPILSCLAGTIIGK